MARRKLNKQQQSRLQQPDQADNWQKGQIVARYSKAVEIQTDHDRFRAQIPAKFQGNSQIDDLIVGDWVYLDELQVIQAKLERSTELVRYRRSTSRVAGHQTDDDIRSARGKAVAANISQLCIVISPNPFVDTLTIDEYLLAAYIQGFKPLIICNKEDITSSEQASQLDDYRLYREAYHKLGYRLIRTSALLNHADTALLDQLAHHTSVFMGTSGVGKSSLINMLLEDNLAVTGGISENAELGKHTTTTARLYKLPNGGSLVDSPGIREFKLATAEPNDLFQTYKDLYNGNSCQYGNCTHREEPNCAVKQALKDKQVFQWRYDNYLALFNSLCQS